MAQGDDLARIIRGCKKGDSRSFSRVVDMYASRCYGYFHRLTGNSDTSDELLSELFVKLVQKIGSYRGGSFESWLFAIASNIFHDHLRSKQRRKKLAEVSQEELEWEIAEPKHSDGEMVDRLQSRLVRLDGETSELIMLRF